ncbi:hypothetical protein ATE84_4411 [Aquimarina sp. MAR_2010_214]|uniref:hypothetical protein n=1 Tax=Aquimarina sp. MAR_2010_214 TaxID=1250026 RepID=UPI000C7125C2|nr:hypothetical protein [Aquimarina sp. MAR_2010_214]PKV52300.1 hypothetical protein ATE84_4411 [Aquimarina sp. MAR_2010_214]
MTVDNILKIIDETHSLAIKSMIQKNLSEYMSVFADELLYKQLNGKIINKKQLTKDTEKYFSRVLSVKSNYKRINHKLETCKFSETLIQEAEVTIRVFIFFRKKWKVLRKGIYKWSMSNQEWKITEVDILEEQIS